MPRRYRELCVLLATLTRKAPIKSQMMRFSRIRSRASRNQAFQTVIDRQKILENKGLFWPPPTLSISEIRQLFFPVTGRIIRVTELPNEISVLGHGDTNSKSVGDQIK